MHTEGPLLVIAGAGSGKTKTLVYRVARLIHDGVNPANILLLTFTRKSSQEMLRRASDVLDARCKKVMGGTFHSFCNMTLHRHVHLLPYPNGFTIMDRGDAENLMALIRKEGDYHKKDKRFPKKGTLLDIVSKAINTNHSIAHVMLEHFPHFADLTEDIVEVSKTYTAKKLALSLMDYDDLLVKTTELLADHPDVCDTLSRQYGHIMVDEFQDTNHIQLMLLQQLSSKHHNIMAVGDDAQSIYSFRGADITNMLQFEDHFPNVTVVKLTVNYRSTQSILDVSNTVIAASTQLFPKELSAHHGKGDKPVFVDVFDDMEQADFVVQRVLELRETVELSSMAVLFRSGTHANALEVALQQANLPFKKFGGFKFTESAHIKDALAYVKVMVNPNDQLSWHRILQLLEGVGPVFAQKLIDYILGVLGQGGVPDFLPFKGKAAYFDLCVLAKAVCISVQDVTPKAVMERVVEAYTPVLKCIYDDYHKREQDLQSLVGIADRFKSVASMLDDMCLDPPEVSQARGEDVDDDEFLTLSTIHSAKGLEWDTVFVLSAVDGYLPSFRSLNDANQLEEERRLMYVAMTRAKRGLYILKPNLDAPGQYYGHGGISFSQVSRFISAEMLDTYFDTWTIGIGDFDSGSKGPDRVIGSASYSL